LAIALVAAIAAWSAGFTRADQPSRTEAQGPALATCVSDNATLVVRAASEKDWHVANKADSFHAGDLLVGLPGGMVDSAGGAVRVTFRANLDYRSPFPIKESAIRLLASDSSDLAFVLDRGRIEITNTKASGSANFVMAVRDAKWKITLAEPGSSVGMEVYGRWPKGAIFAKDPGPKDAPTTSLIILVLKGKIVLKHADFEHAMQAPPGPAMIEWDSVSGHDETPEHLDKLPAWADSADADTPEGKIKLEVLGRFRQALLSGSIDDTLQTFVKSDSEPDRRLAIYVMAALDKLSDLGKAMRETKHADVWDNAVQALRHWIGRGPGQDQLLYKGLIDVAKYEPIQAETVVQLLHSFSDADLARPETYQGLIDYLEHNSPAIRALAYWHLVRLVPQGRSFGYNPGDSKENRDAAIRKWRALVPPHKMPPRQNVPEK
jgi:hypothetical protein